MANVLYFSRAVTERNTENFTVVALHSVLQEQPALGWAKVGDVKYFNLGEISQAKDAFSCEVDLICLTAYFHDLVSGDIFQQVSLLRQSFPGKKIVIGGPVNPDFASDILLKSGADLFFSGSALLSFRTYCELINSSKTADRYIQPNEIRKIPGIHQFRFGLTYLPPETLVQDVSFVKKLKLDSAPLLEYLVRFYLSDRLGIVLAYGPQGRQLHLVYPMFDSCDYGRCTFCDYHPNGLPLSREQRLSYARDLHMSLSRAISLGDIPHDFHGVGPNFDVGDKDFLAFAREQSYQFSIMLRPESLLVPGPVGTRHPNWKLIKELISSGAISFDFGIESAILARRSGYGKTRVTNSEIYEIVHAITMIADTSSKTRDMVSSSFFFIPPSFDVGAKMLSVEHQARTKMLMDFCDGRTYFFTAVNYQYPSIMVLPGTVEYSLMEKFRTMFPRSLESYQGERAIASSYSGKMIYNYPLPLDPVAAMACLSLSSSFTGLDTSKSDILLSMFVDFFVENALSDFSRHLLRRKTDFSPEYLAQLEYVARRKPSNSDLKFVMGYNTEITHAAMERYRKNMPESIAAFDTLAGKSPLLNEQAFQEWKHLHLRRREMARQPRCRAVV